MQYGYGQPGYAACIVPEAQELVAVAAANPFAIDWVYSGVQLRGQAPVYRPASVVPPAWWHVIIQPRGEVYFQGPPTDDEIPTRIQQAQAANATRSSILKMEIKYQLGSGQIRTLRCDVSSGVDLWIGPSSSIEARLLVPDPASAPAVPPGFDTSIWLAASVQIAARCVPDPLSISAGVYSQAVFAPADPLIPFDVPVQTGAQRVQVHADAALTAVEQVWQRRDPGGVLIDEVIVGDVAPIFVGAASTIDARLSGLANLVRIRGGTTGTVVQSLQF